MQVLRRRSSGIGFMLATVLILILSFSTASAATILSDGFDPDIDFSMWSDISNGFANTDCGSVSGNALKFGNGEQGGRPQSESVAPVPGGDEIRYATTKAVNVSNGGKVSFYLVIGSGEGEGSGCEAADEGEDVVLEYSTNGGETWGLMGIYNSGSFPNFTLISAEIPADARSGSTLFRWSQLDNSGGCCDNWALDNVVIDSATATSCGIFDGRLNTDCGAPVAIFWGDTLDVYGIGPESAEGWLDVRITDADIEVSGIPTDGPYLITQGVNHWTGRSIFIWRLTTGEFQLNTFYADGKPYVFVWNVLGAGYNVAF